MSAAPFDHLCQTESSGSTGPPWKSITFHPFPSVFNLLPRSRSLTFFSYSSRLFSLPRSSSLIFSHPSPPLCLQPSLSASLSLSSSWSSSDLFCLVESESAVLTPRLWRSIVKVERLFEEQGLWNPKPLSIWIKQEFSLDPDCGADLLVCHLSLPDSGARPCFCVSRFPFVVSSLTFCSSTFSLSLSLQLALPSSSFSPTCVSPAPLTLTQSVTLSLGSLSDLFITALKY